MSAFACNPRTPTQRSKVKTKPHKEHAICAPKSPLPTNRRLAAIYDALLAHFGHRNWWPGETPFEVVVGAILTQNTAWKNVELAISNLKGRGLLTPKRLYEADISTLAELIKPTGYFNQKAKKLKAFSDFLSDNYNGSLEALFSQNAEELRRELLGVWGIGYETADSIILYAANKLTFVIDAYTKRILVRKGIVDEGASYEYMKQLFERNLPEDVELYNDYHAQLVALGKNICRPRPTCDACPIREL